MSESPSSSVFFFGNPLLDLTVSLESKSEEDHFVSKYDLVPGVGQEGETVTSGFLEHVRTLSPTLSPGGCAQNSARVFRWLGRSGSSGSGGCLPVMVGSVGLDQEAAKLKRIVEGEDGVLTCFAENERLPTGHCINLVRDSERTMVANLGAANHFDARDFSALDLDLRLSREAVHVYVEGYFALHSPEVTRTVAEICAAHKIGLSFNLNGEYACRDRDFVLLTLELMAEVGILFGNRSEFETFLPLAESLTGDANCRELSNHLLLGNNPKKLTTNKKVATSSSSSLTVVMTDGPRSVTVLQLDPKAHQVTSKVVNNVPPIPENEIVDTVGAGDSFVAGYLSAFLEGKDRSLCIKNGIAASRMIIPNWDLTAGISMIVLGYWLAFLPDSVFIITEAVMLYV